MKIVLINKSDATGGAAIVSFRLMMALRDAGHDARMLVTEKLTDSPYVERIASPGAVRIPFLKERLKIFLSNGFNRSTLFKIDTGSDGLPLWRHPLVMNADAILLNWINQGMLSLDGVSKILRLGKPVVWTMHDMWCMTGVCHHAGVCTGFKGECRECPLLKGNLTRKNLARKVWQHKKLVYSSPDKIKFVAVSTWLKEKAAESSLLWKQNVSVIPNAFHPGEKIIHSQQNITSTIHIGFGAARLDDPIKGLPVLSEATRIIRDDNPELASRLELVTFGNVKNPDSLSGIGIRHRHLGIIKGEEALREVYANLDIVASSSSYETLPGTLVEAQAYGCIPVSFSQGGQRDITDHLSTGYIAEYSPAPQVAARNLANGLEWAAGIAADPEAMEAMRTRMRESVMKKFDARVVAKAYLDLLG